MFNMKLNLILGLLSFSGCICLELSRCSIYDSKCQLTFFQTMGAQKAADGIPEIGIPKIDPFSLSTFMLEVLGLWNITLIEGQAEGISRCLVINYESNVENRYKEPEIICDKIIIRGRYNLTSSPSLKKAVADFHGEGCGTLTFVNWYFKIRYPFEIVKERDGEIYVKGLFERAVYETRVDKVIVDADGIKMGKYDISKSATCFINRYWRYIMVSDIGKRIYDQSLQYYYDIYQIFFDRVPAKQYYSDDFTNLVDRVN